MCDLSLLLVSFFILSIYLFLLFLIMFHSCFLVLLYVLFLRLVIFLFLFFCLFIPQCISFLVSVAIGSSGAVHPSPLPHNDPFLILLFLPSPPSFIPLFLLVFSLCLLSVSPLAQNVISDYLRVNTLLLHTSSSPGRHPSVLHSPEAFQSASLSLLVMLQLTNI